jgi:hypothetical protein
LKPTFQSKIWCSLGKYRYKSIIEKYCIPQWRTTGQFTNLSMFNGKPCNLINPVSSSSYRSFKQICCSD